ncbi:MBOAT, membrane-bound O-acyltransferase family-domain-containing protein [Coniella lustricola]|uniref:O-acyltransferase n=1 Tax=Coniella lustricola TaxID=2025994 RepID=A0A2T3AEP2_9PEZI|nr:MBOAT, membrane-bound O-acyltransferase family-domain-containing protein [Coniella lustricola]
MDRAMSSTGTETTASNILRHRPADLQPQLPHGRSDHGGHASDGSSIPSGNKSPKPALSKKYRHIAAIHCASQPSTLSHDAAATPSFLGFRNLGLIVLIAGNLRLLIENIQKYGVLICVRCHDFRKQDLQVGLILYTLVPCCLLIAYLIELFAGFEARTQRLRLYNKRFGNDTRGEKDDQASDAPARDGRTSPTEDEQARFRMTWYIIAALHACNISIGLVITSWAVYYYVNHPLIGTMVEMHAIIVWLKTASYALTNRDLRHAHLHPQTGELESIPELYKTCPYPENVTFGNLCYFWWAPTLIYQPVYPRTDKIRWVFVAKRLLEVVGLCVVMWLLSAQYAAPTLQNSLRAWREWDVAAMVERVLKLSTISLVIWLAGFFALFQSFLNALAEVTRFADRSFYDDWWNSDSLGTYWRTWNKPVSNYFRRHVFSPLMGRGYSFHFAASVVFSLSALLHELAVGIPTHNVIGVAFIGMLIQLPLIGFTKRFEKANSPTRKMIGNCIFWVTFTTFGQPFAALCYFYAWQIKFGSISEKWNSSQAQFVSA